MYPFHESISAYVVIVVCYLLEVKLEFNNMLRKVWDIKAYKRSIMAFVYYEGKGNSRSHIVFTRLYIKKTE